MNKKITPILTSLLVIIMAGTLLAACGTSSSASSGTDGASLLQSRCSVCHSTTRITGLQGTADQWKGLVDNMIQRGAQLTPAEETTLVAYLAQTYHP